MAVRKIPKNYLSVTGSFASQKNDQMDEFESLLEKEHLMLLEFDETVDRFEVQPVNIPVPGERKGYTPDALVHFLADPHTGEIRRTSLIEVKHTDDLQRHAEKYKNKFSLATKFAEEQGWEFCIKTQHDIRTQRLKNIKFLREYRNIDVHEQDQQQLLLTARSLGHTFSVQAMLDQLALSDDAQLHWLPIIWRAILNRTLAADWDRPLTYNTLLQLQPEA
jgi:hypothetical protein